MRNGVSTVVVRYIAELLAEKQKLAPFMPVLPCTSRLLNQEILHVSTLLGIPVLDQPGYQHGSPLINGGAIPNGRPIEMNGWAPAIPSEGSGMFHPPSRNWLNPQGNSGFIVKKTMRMDIPVEKYPNFNFVGRLLGPRGNSLKQVEANTDCRVLIRGRSSIKDAAREELMRGKAGYEHLNEPLHLLIEAELPAEIVDIRLMQAREILNNMLKPVDESMDFFKKQQLRELAMLNGTLRDDSSQKSGSLSPFHNNMGGMKRAKTRG
ncbi:KH domain-containing protein At4g26480-like isoform X2 [Phragmites australis]|uniref:KH domain-containing protein At4g26480-like isoform X2 n=1 Tax=Phragmites australis TaxID=29695 RepID=UPI002D78C4EE|nr:KH domain-containing protein At4g26480-like isoform X2 [Phragmites australis]